MRTRLLGGVLLVAMTLGCASDKKEARPAGEAAPAAEKPAESPAPAAAAPAALPRGVGRTLVKGGETLALQDATVVVKRVAYLNQPCPPDVKCAHSGIVKSVQFEVQHAGRSEEAFVAEGAQQVINTVMVRVLAVEEGPQAWVEASLPVGK